MNQELTISYETRNVPPPFSFRTSIRVEKKDTLGVRFNLEYTDRDELDEEEILDEGFTGNDDISWTGQLPAAWTAALDELLAKTTWAAKMPRSQTSLVTVGSTTDPAKYPANQEQWEYWIQELQQACLEAASIEKPLEIDFAKGERKLGLKASFVRREATLEDFSQPGGVKNPVAWNSLKRVMKHIYIADFLPEEALKSYDKKGDLFLQLGNGQWYNVNKANLFLKKKQEWLEQLEKLFNGLVTDPSA